MRRRVFRGAGLAVACAMLLASGAHAARLPRLAADVEVRSLSFRFEGTHELFPADLTPQIATAAEGTLGRFHKMVAWVPLVPDPSRHPFSPLVLQEDLVRLRRHYRRQGFLEAALDYAVSMDQSRRWVSVTFTIREGPPIRIRSVTLVDTLGGEMDLEPFGTDFKTEWEKARTVLIGRRFHEELLASMTQGVRGAFLDRGFASAMVEPRAAVDSAAHLADVALAVTPGPRLTIASVEIDGVHSVPNDIVTRQLAIQPGDVASRRSVADGRANLQSVSLFRSAEVALDTLATGANALPVKVRVSEGTPRFTNLEIGYVTDGAGITSQARWTHPNFTGGARSLDVIGLVQTGWFTTSDEPNKLGRATVTLTQPYVWSPRMSLGVGPAIEFRDNYVDRSHAYSGQATLVYRLNALQSVALRYEYTYRKVDQPRTLEFDYGHVVTDLQEQLEVPTTSSLFTASSTFGRFDELSRPRHGLVLKPNLSVTAPPSAGNIEFARADMEATAFFPFLGRTNGFMVRGTAGGLWPYGHSIPDPDNGPAIELIRLRDQLLMVGGSSDVRGYDNRLLGPKVPAIVAEEVNGDTILTSDHYVPVGGLRRVAATAELRLGLPWFGRNVYGHLFADAGRVWTTDSRFEIATVEKDGERMFYTTGGGVGYYTPVGAIRVDVGYKLNPSTLDVRHAGDVATAVQEGRPVTSAPVDNGMRYHIHLSLGLFF